MAKRRHLLDTHASRMKVLAELAQRTPTPSRKPTPALVVGQAPLGLHPAPSLSDRERGQTLVVLKGRPARGTSTAIHFEPSRLVAPTTRVSDRIGKATASPVLQQLLQHAFKE